MVGLLVAALLVAPVQAGGRSERTAEFAGWMRSSAAAVKAELAKPKPEPVVREVANAALATLATGGSAAEAGRFLRTAFSYQDMDPKSPQYGTIPWRAGHPEIRDPNSIEFCMQPVGPVLHGFGKALSPGFRREMEPHLRAAFAAMRRHDVKISYTNIYLMKMVNLILAGEAIGDTAAADDGYAMLDRWIEYTRQAGIGEFLSTNYYAVDLASPMMGRLYAARPGAAAKFTRILDLFWTDIAANFFPGAETLSGPHSRDYDFLTSHGAVDLYLYQEGLRKTPALAGGAGVGRVYLLVNELGRGYHPGADILRLASLPERVVTGRWRAEPHYTRYNYVTPEFAIGSSNYHYGSQDKLINIELASPGRESNAISVPPDMSDQPYGVLKSFDRSGHSKPVHLPLNAVSVQEKGALLVLLDIDPSVKAASSSLAANVLLPAAAKFVLDGREVTVAAPFEKEATAGSVVGVRSGKAGLAVRMFHLDGAGGGTGRIVLKADAPGLENGMIRLAGYHYRGESRQFADAHVRAGILFLAGKCAGAADLAALMRSVATAKLEQSAAEKVWGVSAEFNGVRLEAARDMESREPVFRRVNGQDAATPALWVNGRDVTGELFGAAR